ncbi:hypothetical protein EYF80_016661 [Liparis tanakae]|uniref:Uncharacterized protein n=1 Tax=Liparis tanakae TaxID=230148 RepID=A0A4Z2I6U4_9TELE|nr:hypothetical protein EYF80_016661 [Liparis tanakae]
MWGAGRQKQLLGRVAPGRRNRHRLGPAPCRRGFGRRGAGPTGFFTRRARRRRRVRPRPEGGRGGATEFRDADSGFVFADIRLRFRGYGYVVGSPDPSSAEHTLA